MKEGTRSADLLLEDLKWLRDLAGRLVRDPEQAEDAVQDTLVTALTRRPRRTDSLRAWLAAVLRNAVRQEQRKAARRTAREARVAAETRGESAPSAASIVAELSLQRRIVELVNELDEPYRTTIVRRFLHGRSPREIARDTGIPVKTVHTRIERAIARLRARLDREHGGDRSAWSTVLLPLTRTSMGPVLKPVVVAMNAKLFGWTVGIAVVGALLALPFVVGSEPEESAAAPATGGAEEVDPVARGGDDHPVDPGVDAGRRAVGAASVRDAEPEPAPAEPAATLRGSVHELDGRPVPGIAVVFERERDGAFVRDADIAPATTDADGAFELPLPAGRGRLGVVSDAYASVSRPYLEGSLPDDPPIVVVAPSRDYAGRVVNAEGEPIENARVEVSLDGSFLQSSFLRTGVDGRTVHLLLPFAEGRTDAYGEFAFPGVGRVEGAFVEAARDGYAAARVALAEHSQLDLELVLNRPKRKGHFVHGLVLDANGAPAADALVSMGWDSVRTDPAGRFTLDLGPWRDGGPVTAVKAGHLPGTAEFVLEEGGEGTDESRPLTLYLGGPPPSIRGRVLDDSGEPVAGVKVWTPDTTFFGKAVYRRDGKSLLGESTAERLVAGREEGGPWAMGVEATTDEHGAFALVGLLEREYAVYALDPATLASAVPVLAEAGDGSVVLRLEGAETRRRVAGRVVSRAGAPLADVRVALGRRVVWERPTPRPTAGWDRSPLRPPSATQTFLDRHVATDAEGRFAFDALHAEHAFLNLTGSAILLAELVTLDDHDDLEALEVVVEVACRFVVVLEDPDEADAFARVDADGGVLPLFVQLESHTVSAPEVAIVEGRSGVARVDEGACTLVLTKDGNEVRRVEVTLEPGGIQELWL